MTGRSVLWPRPVRPSSLVWGPVLPAFLVLGAFLIPMLSGCGAGGSVSARDSGPEGSDGESVSVLYAGALVRAMEDGVGPAFSDGSGIDYRGEGKGSVAGVNLIQDGLRDPDVYISADPSVNELLMGGPEPQVTWFLTFASTEMVLAYSSESERTAPFRQAAAGDIAWHEALRTPGLRIGRSDPDLDPSGYRALFTLSLAEEVLGLPGLKREILGPDQNPRQIYPEEDLAARLEVGEVDVAFMYQTVALSHGLPYLQLPEEVNQGSPEFAPLYAEQEYTDRDRGVTFRGAPIVFTATVLEGAKNREGGTALVRFLVGSQGADVLSDYGVQPLPPVVTGDAGAVPEEISVLLDESRLNKGTRSDHTAKEGQ